MEMLSTTPRSPKASCVSQDPLNNLSCSVTSSTVLLICYGLTAVLELCQAGQLALLFRNTAEAPEMLTVSGVNYPHTVSSVSLLALVKQWPIWGPKSLYVIV